MTNEQLKSLTSEQIKLYIQEQHKSLMTKIKEDPKLEKDIVPLCSGIEMCRHELIKRGDFL